MRLWRRTDQCRHDPALVMKGLNMTIERLIEIIAEQLDKDPEEITATSTFEELGIDSLDTAELLMELEDELDVELEVEEKMATVQELHQFIQSKV